MVVQVTVLPFSTKPGLQRTYALNVLLETKQDMVTTIIAIIMIITIVIVMVGITTPITAGLVTESKMETG